MQFCMMQPILCTVELHVSGRVHGSVQLTGVRLDGSACRESDSAADFSKQHIWHRVTKGYSNYSGIGLSYVQKEPEMWLIRAEEKTKAVTYTIWHQHFYFKTCAKIMIP